MHSYATVSGGFLTQNFSLFSVGGVGPCALKCKGPGLYLQWSPGRIQEFSRGGIVRRYGDGSSPVEFRGKNPSRGSGNKVPGN